MSILDTATEEKVKPTDEQLHVLDLMKDKDRPIMIRAFAGTGKSSTLEMDTKPRLYVVFAKRNCDEAIKKQKAGKIGRDVTIVTANGLGHRGWAKALGMKLNLDDNKCRDIYKTMIRNAPKPQQNEMWNVYNDVLSTIKMAKSVGYIPDGTYPFANHLLTREEFMDLDIHDERISETVMRQVDAVLNQSIISAYSGTIDYNDQIYMSALFGGKWDWYPQAQVDEYQDMNPVNHVMLYKIFDNHCRPVGVGDECQNIFKFRGAQQGGMQKTIDRYSMDVCELSVCFRCPQAVVENARWRVPQFKWIKPGGHVERLPTLDYRDFPDHATIICRNNAPIFRLAMQLISSGRSVSVAGTDIGPRVVNIMRRLGNEDMSRASLVAAIRDWKEAKLEQESKTAVDIADCMLAFAERGKTLGQAIGYAEWLFKQEGNIHLLTGHKSKGLEFDTVYLLDTFLLKDDEQDLNLRYVMQTRSSNQLFEIDSNNIKWS